MFPILFAVILGVQVGPMGPDAPTKEPQLAVNKSMVGLAFGAGNSVYFSRSDDSGASFAAPVKVAQTSILPLNRHRGPRVVITGTTIVISAVAGKIAAEGAHAHGLPSDGDLLMWRSTDAGKTWSRGIRVNDVPGAPTEGLHSLAADAKGTLFAAWLDHRSGHGTQLYGARSTDGGLTWSKNVKIYESPDSTICECCHPSVAFDPSGQALVMWRNSLNGSRDMYLTRSSDGVAFSAGEKLGMGTWKLNACPMDGGGLVVSNGKVISAWRRDGEIFLSSPGEMEAGLGKGVDVSIAPAKGGVYAIWKASNGIMAAAPGTSVPFQVAAQGAFPTVATLPDGRGLAAWEADGKIEIRPLRLGHH